MENDVTSSKINIFYKLWIEMYFDITNRSTSQKFEVRENTYVGLTANGSEKIDFLRRLVEETF